MITHFEQIPTYIVCGVFTSFHFASQSNGHLLCFPLNKSAFPAAIWYLDVFGHMIPQMLYRIASHYHTQSGSWVFLRHMDFYHWKFNKLSRGKPYHSVVPVICDFIPYIHHGFCGVFNMNGGLYEFTNNKTSLFAGSILIFVGQAH